MLCLSPDFSIPIAHLFSSRIALLGKSGSGKTNTMQVIASACRENAIPYTFINPISQLHPMPGAVIVRWRDPDALTLTEASAPLLAELAVHERLTVLIDLRMCPADERDPLVTAYLKRLWEMLLEQDTPSPYGVFLDEADLFAPQDAVKPAKRTLIDMAMRGRHMGVISVVATQRPARIDKDILNQASLTIVHRLSAQTDTKILGDQLPDISPRMLNQTMRQLATGQAVIIGDPLFLGDADYRTVQIRFAGDVAQGEQAMTLTPARELDDTLMQRLRDTLLHAPVSKIELPARTVTTAFPSPPVPDDIAALRRQIAELNEKVIGLYRQMSKPLVVEPKPAFVPVGTQMALIEQEDSAQEEVIVERMTERTTYTSSRSLNRRIQFQSTGFAELLSTVRGFNRFQRTMLLMMCENNGKEYTPEMLSPFFDRAPKTVYEAALLLKRTGLIAQVKPRVYKADLMPVLAERFPDLTASELFQRLMNALAA